jgi:hypothetical protein
MGGMAILAMLEHGRDARGTTGTPAVRPPKKEQGQRGLALWV